MKDYLSEDRSLHLVRADFLDADGLFELHSTTGSRFDLVITSPPYNLGKGYADGDDKPYAEYLDWSRRWMGMAHKFCAPHARFCLNIPLDKNKGGHHPVYADLVRMAVEARWSYFTTIVWNEGNISRRTAWGSWLSPSAPYVIAPVEMVAVFSKGDWGWPEQRGERGDCTREEFIGWTNGLWTFPGESAKRIGHPSPFPVELPRRLIKLFSFRGMKVLDPFVGSGTTLVACRELGRKGMGFEKDARYVKLARTRLGI